MLCSSQTLNLEYLDSFALLHPDEFELMRTHSVCGEPKTHVLFLVGSIEEIGKVMVQP